MTAPHNVFSIFEATKISYHQASRDQYNLKSNRAGLVTLLRTLTDQTLEASITLTAGILRNTLITTLLMNEVERIKTSSGPISININRAARDTLDRRDWAK
ncbi:hypothetical protein FRC02_008155 [Tulasnella sp. 418]|nr:hypothetical protein FRC02_008155 [Tulasnella sp. 418]